MYLSAENLRRFVRLIFPPRGWPESGVVHMARGEVWLFDRLAPYGVYNPTEWPRVHLTIETSGSSRQT